MLHHVPQKSQVSSIIQLIKRDFIIDNWTEKLKHSINSSYFGLGWYHL